MSEHAPGLWPVPGDGVLARKGGLVLLSSLEDSQFVDVLLDLLERHAASGGDGRSFTDAVAGAIEAGTHDEAGQGPSLLAFGPTRTGLAVTVSGGAWADVITARGTARIEAGHPEMLMRCLLRSASAGVRGGLSHADNGSASTDRFSRLDAGTVRAGGLAFFEASGPEAEGSAVPAAPAGRPASLAKPSSARQAAPSAVPPPPPSSGLDQADAGQADAGPADAGQADAGPGDAGTVEPEVPPTGPDEAPRAAEPAVEAGADALTTDLMPEVDKAIPAIHEPTAAWITPAEPGVTIAPEPAEPAEPFEAVLLHGQAPGLDVPQREPLSLARNIPAGTSSYVSQGPIIQGVYCKNGHFDDPEALFCAICGISMNQQTLVPRPGERPPLGVLLLDDGSVFQLDTDYVVGREPGLDASVAEGKARSLRVTDESGIVSRVHARVHLDGWRVLITDLGSANGTRVLLPGRPGEQPLVPQIPLVLATGSQVDLGGRAFRYESHRGR